MRHVDLQNLCERILEYEHGVWSCAVVDLGTGLSVASHVRPDSPLTEEAMTQLFAAGTSYFAGSSALGQEAANAAQLPTDVREIQTMTPSTFNFMSLVPNAEHELLILVTDRSASNLGLGWMVMRQAMERVRELDAGPKDPANHMGARATPYQPRSEPAQKPKLQVRDGGVRRTIRKRL